MFKLFGHYGKDYWWQVILAPIFKIFEAIFGLIVPLVVKNIIDNGIDGNFGTDYIVQQALILLLLAVVGFLMTMVCQAFAVNVTSSFGYAVRKDMYRKINALSYKELDKFTASSLQTRLSSDVIATQKAFAMLLRLAIRAPFIVIGSIIMSAILEPSMAWIFIVCGVLLGLIILVIGYFSIPYNTHIQEEMDNATTIGDDNLTGVRVVRAFNKQDYEMNRYLKVTSKIQNLSEKLAKLTSLSNPLNTVVVNLGLIAILYFGSINITSGGMTTGKITALVNYMTQIAQAVVVVANLIVVFSKGSSSAKRIQEVLDSKSSLKEGNLIIGSDVPEIKLNDVSFKYSKSGEEVLKDINVTLAPKSTIGIIGGTGSGKTTLVNLIAHFYDVESGEITLDSKNIQEYQSGDIYSKVGFVSQNPLLFSGTIESNLKFGNAEASEEDMMEACKIAQCEDIVKAKGGLQSRVNQGGKNFSGGQKQRLTIARALVSKPKILILDDASSALDLKTDYNLRKAIKDKIKNATVIIVSQRVSSIKDADQILVMDKGQCVGVGQHSSLLHTCQTYQDICASQGLKEVQ